MLIKKVAVPVSLRNGWQSGWKTTSYERMKVQSDAEQSIKHLLMAVKSVCTADLTVQRALVKSQVSRISRLVRCAGKNEC